MALREEVPREFSDDARWYKFFTNQMFAATLIILVAGRILYAFLAKFHLGIVGIVITGIIWIVTLILLGVPVPKGNLTGGSGLILGQVLIRLWIRKKKRVIYIKGYKGES